jgi:hypothetical protein
MTAGGRATSSARLRNLSISNAVSLHDPSVSATPLIAHHGANLLAKRDDPFGPPSSGAPRIRCPRDPGNSIASRTDPQTPDR